MDHPPPQLDAPPDVAGSAADDAPPAAPLPAPPPGVPLRTSVRRVLHAAALFVIVFLFVRMFAVEPFGVPTGSMAPTLLGNHREAACPRCGYRVVVGDPGGDRANGWFAAAACPNCGKRNVDLSAAQEIPGDRLLVDKNVYNLRPPRRWEVGVFRCPVDDTKPYVKRVVGLPGEAVQVVGGDVFADGVLLRKTLAQVRQTRIPVFDMNCQPPGGWGVRWLVEPVAGDPKAALPATDEVVRGAELHLDAADRPAVGLTYRHWRLDDAKEEAVTDALGYNGPRRGKPSPAYDFVFRCDVEVQAGTGSFALRLGDGLDTVSAEFPVGAGGVTLTRDGAADSAVTGSASLEVGKTYAVEFALVDRRASLAIDGTQVVAAIDLPADAGMLALRKPVARPVQLGAKGVRVVVRNVRIDRDIHYQTEGAHGTTAPHRLGPDEYFVLGDNSGNSNDSREWAIPGVPGKDFVGKPFLIHQPLRLGRVAVNGRDRTYQTVDWARLRWLR